MSSWGLVCNAREPQLRPRLFLTAPSDAAIHADGFGYRGGEGRDETGPGFPGEGQNVRMFDYDL